MKFTDGAWLTRPGVAASYARQALEVECDGAAITALAPTREIRHREDTLDGPVLSLRLWSPMPGVIGVRIEHFAAGDALRFELPGSVDGAGSAIVDGGVARLTSGSITATLHPGPPWRLEFHDGDRLLTRSDDRSISLMTVDPALDGHGIGLQPSASRTGASPAPAYLVQQLGLGVGEQIFGLGERFGPFVKNGQSVDLWNSDGGTASEQSYKNIPFALSSRGYGVFINEPGHVSFEIGTERVSRMQMAVGGESLEYFIIGGPTPRAALERYTALTGRPPVLPDWSFGLWMSTSFTTDYDEATVTGFLDRMQEHDIPVGVFHFDCFWMRPFRWVDFEWNPDVFPDPEGMLARLHERGIKVCVWINPYIAQRSPLFAEAAERGYLLRAADGTPWQTDYWQPGMGLVDFTSPEATGWFQDHLRGLIAQGVDTFKTDFGERIPTDVVYADSADPQRMHNLYAQRYNQAVFDVLEEAKGAGEAVLFARSATAGGQRLPVHWGGDNEATFESMAETLRGGLSLALSGFAYWSHDIGGFEGTPDAALFKRWLAFGMLSTHSRLHGRASYRAPWEFDRGDEPAGQSAVEVARRFARLKAGLMPYLTGLGRLAARDGTPVARPMLLEFPDDPTAVALDRQYMLGDALLVAPVFTADGDVEFYLPEGEWSSLLTGETVTGGGWRREQHGFDSLPLYVRDGALLPWADEATGRLVLLAQRAGRLDPRPAVTVGPDGGLLEFRRIAGPGGAVEIVGPEDAEFAVRLADGTELAAVGGRVGIPNLV